MELFLIISIFILGAIIGSFLNVTIYRHNTGRGFGGRSACMSCARTLRPYELIPILSFLIQKGKCLRCQSRISIIYPLVEFLTGLVFVSVYLVQVKIFGFQISSALILNLLYFWSIFSILFMIAVYDIRHKIIPDGPVYTFIFLSFISPIISSGIFDIAQIAGNILAGFLIALPFVLLWLLSKGRLMGLGDAKLALGIGALLGLSQGLTAMLFAFWIGALVGLFLIAFKFLFKKTNFTMKSELPFGPFLAISAFLVFIFNFDLNAIFRIFNF